MIIFDFLYLILKVIIVILPVIGFTHVGFVTWSEFYKKEKTVSNFFRYSFLRFITQENAHNEQHFFFEQIVFLLKGLFCMVWFWTSLSIISN